MKGRPVSSAAGAMVARGLGDEEIVQASSPAKSYALLLGFALAIAGILGFFYSADFSSGTDVPTADVVGVFAVNGWVNVLHVVSGLLGLAAARSPASARLFAFGLGSIYVGIAIWGFILGANGTIAELIPISTATNVLHAVIGGLGLAATISSPGATPMPTADRAHAQRPEPDRA